MIFAARAAGCSLSSDISNSPLGWDLHIRKPSSFVNEKGQSSNEKLIVVASYAGAFGSTGGTTTVSPGRLGEPVSTVVGVPVAGSVTVTVPAGGVVGKVA